MTGPGTTGPGAGRPADVRVAVVGCGAWGRNHARNHAEIGTLAAVVDRKESARNDFAAAFGVRALDLDEAVADPSIDAFVCALPPSLHYQVGKRAMQAGKHVLLEKPIAMEAWQAEELCATAERLDRRLMVGHILQYHPAFLKLRDIVREGSLGRLQYISANRLDLGKIRREEDILWSLAPHDISMILALIGTEPVKVEAVGGYFLHQSIADVSTTHLAFPGGEQAHIFVSWLHPYKEQRLVVVGTDAMAVFDDREPWERKLVLYPHKVQWIDNVPVPNMAAAVPVPVEPNEPLRQESLHFLDCVRTGARPRTDGREGLAVVRVLARASDALRAGRAAQQPTPAAPGTRVARSYPGVQIQETAFVDPGVEIGDGTRVGHFSHILGQVRIGRHVSVGQSVVIGPDASVGDRCRIESNVAVVQGVTLEEGVLLGPSCVFMDFDRPRAEHALGADVAPTLVKRGATIGANATVVCGRTVGAFAFVEAGAVVSEDVPDYALMAGAPAKRVGWVGRAGYRLGPDLLCPQTRRRYRETAQGTLEEVA